MGRALAQAAVVSMAALGLAWLTAAGPSHRRSVSGFVLDADGPVAGATVRVRATDNQTLSAKDGSFTLENLRGGQALTITAWAQGYLIGWTTASPGDRGARITVERHYTADNADYDWFSAEGSRGSRTCGKCMPGLHAEWQADAHSQSAVNPRFLTTYLGTDTQGNQSPPTRHITERDYGRRPLPPDPNRPYFGPGYKLDFPETAGNCATCHVPAAAAKPDQAYSADVKDAIGVETEGVFCEFCHKIGGVVLDPATGLPPPNMPGVLSMRLYRPSEGQELFFGTLDDVTRRVTKLPLQQESAFCAPCHSATFWDTVVYNSYGEWLNSRYSDSDEGQTCQECHMPATDATLIALPEFGGVQRRPGFVSSHRMPGAADAEFLRDTAELEVKARPRGGRILVDALVTNAKAGHHLPTGHPSRNMLLVVSATAQGGRELECLDGRLIPAWGGQGDEPDDYAGRPGKGYAKVLQEMWTGVWPTVAYWNPTTVREDTRIPAGATDVTHYEFRAPAAGRRVTVRARLIFRRAFKELAEQKQWDLGDILMEEEEVTVP
ncbi:MAG: carboxypeptidase regulatory-like domain-containing protein [Armatimonadota bacterium]